MSIFGAIKNIFTTAEQVAEAGQEIVGIAKNVETGLAQAASLLPIDDDSEPEIIDVQEAHETQDDDDAA
jgi:hypothetical protein